MFVRMAIFALLISYTWYSLLKIILIRKEIRRVKMHASNSTNTDIESFGNWSPSTLSVEEEIDFSQLEYRDVIVLMLFFAFTYYIAEIWRGWLHIIYHFWEPAIDMEMEIEREPDREAEANRIEEDDD